MKLSIPEAVSTERLILRRLRYEEAEEIFYGYASKPEATQFVVWPTHRKIEDTRNFLAYAIPAWDAGTDFSFSIRLIDGARYIGSFGIMNDHGKIQFGYAISPAHWNKGYATEATIQMMKMLKSLNGIYRIGTLVDIDNASSSRVLLKAGLVEEARLTKWMRFVNQSNQPKDCILYKIP